MAEYYTDWEQVDKEEVPTLVEAVARYMSTTNYPDIAVACSILGIKEEKEKINE